MITSFRQSLCLAFRAIYRCVATACLTALLGAATADAQQRSDDALTLQAAIERAFAANPRNRKSRSVLVDDDLHEEDRT
jgi:hypothetical protein